MVNIKPVLLSILVVGFASAGIPATADEKHAHDHGAKHGGQFVEVEGHHGIEMVSDESAIGFFLTEEGKPMDIEGGSFKAIVQTDAGTKIIPLTVKDGKLAGKLEAALPKGAKIAFSGKDSHGHAIQGRFVKE